MYTDYVGNPIAAGDHVCYGVKSGSSAVSMTLARVKEVVPIHPLDPSDPHNCKGHTDADIAKGKDEWDARYIASRAEKDPSTGGRTWNHLRDDSKAYILKVQRLRDGFGGWMIVDTDKVTTIHNITNVVVVNLPEVAE